MIQLFVTGAPRTGTTLLDKLLSMHPNVVVYSQPLPLLYVHLKRAFLAAVAHEQAASAYPLSDMFLSNYYEPDRFVAFLSDTVIDAATASGVLGAMTTYSGQYTRPNDARSFLDGYRACSLRDFVSRYCDRLAESPLRREITVTGAKESFCEEFIPYYLANGAHVVQMIRDPRDSIASLNHGDASVHAGRPRPLLFCIRQWRKSAAFALAHAGHARFRAVRYEDLVTAPARALDAIARDLGLGPFEEHAFDAELRTAEGAVWQSNSSHRPTTRLSRDSIGAHRDGLSAEARSLVEACCHPEMLAFGYQPEIRADELSSALTRYREDATPLRAELSEYRWSAERAREEQARIDAIDACAYDPRLFLFREAFDSLKRHRWAVR